MKEGRMKGQAFITLPSEEKAKKALRDAHGYILHGKPMVIVSLFIYHLFTLISLHKARDFSSLFIGSWPGGYSSEFVVGVCRPILQILTLFQTKTCHFPYPFSDLASKIHTHFQT